MRPADGNHGLGVAVLGVGWAGRAHVREHMLNAMRAPAPDGGPRVVAIADVDADRARALARSVGATAYADWRHAIEDPEVSIVDVCLPDDLHPAAAIAAAEAGKPVLCEKPMAPTIAAARAMTEAVATAGVTNMMSYQYRHLPCMRLARSLIEDGVLGQLCSIQVSFERDVGLTDAVRGGWRRAANPAGSLAGMGTHALDLVGLFAGPISEVTASLRYGPSATPENQQVIETADLLLRLAGGASGAVHVSWAVVGRKHDLTIECAGTRATLLVRSSELNRVRLATSSRPEDGFRTLYVAPDKADLISHGSAVGFDAGLYDELTYFADRASHGETASPTFADALKTEAVVAAARTPAAAAGWVRLDR